MTLDYKLLSHKGIQTLSPYQTGKPIDTLKRELGLENIIKLGSNENPIGCSPVVAKAISKQLDSLHLYPDPDAYELKSKLAAIHNIPFNSITLGNGSDTLLTSLIHAFGQEHKTILTTEYAFATYAIGAKAFDRELKLVALNNFEYDVDAIIDAIDNRVSMLFLANPNNPINSWVNHNQLLHLMANTPEEVLVVLDEAYYEYMQQENYPDSISLLSKYPNLIITRTFSKIYGLASLRIGYCFSNPAIAEILNRIRSPFNVSTFAQLAAAVALGDNAHLQRSLAVNNQGQIQLKQAFDAMDLKYIDSVTNFFSVKFGGDAMIIYNRLLAKGIIVRPLAAYGLPNYLRISIGTREQNQYLIYALQEILGK